MSGAPDPRPAATRKPKRVTQAERDARARFKQAVLALDRECVAGPVGDGCEPPLRAHHVLSQQQLRHAGLADALWLPEVGACVCERHHRRHHNRTEPIRRDLLPERCLRFVADHDLYYIIERFYPVSG